MSRLIKNSRINIYWSLLASILAGILVYWIWDLAEIPSGGAGQIYFTSAIAGILIFFPLLQYLFKLTLENDHSPLGVEQAAVFLVFGFLALETAWRWIGNWKLFLGFVVLAMIAVQWGGLTARLDQRWRKGNLAPREIAWFIFLVLGLTGALLVGWVRGLEWQAGTGFPMTGWWVKGCLMSLAVAGAVALLVYRLLQQDTGRRLHPGSLAAVIGLNPLFPLALRSKWGALAAIVLVVAMGMVVHLLTSESGSARFTTGRWLHRETLVAFGIPWWAATGLLTLSAGWTIEAKDIYVQHALVLGPTLLASLATGWGLAVFPFLRPFLPAVITGGILVALLPVIFLAPAQSPEPFLLRTPLSEERNVLKREVVLSRKNPEHRVPLERDATASSIVHAVRLSLSLANAVAVPQGAVVGEVLLVWADDALQRVPLRAGIEVAEWAIERQDVARAVKHRRARVGENWLVRFPTGESFVAHHYRLEFPVSEGGLQEIQLLWHQPGEEREMLLNIHRVVLVEKALSTKQ